MDVGYMAPVATADFEDKSCRLVGLRSLSCSNVHLHDALIKDVLAGFPFFFQGLHARL